MIRRGRMRLLLGASLVLVALAVPAALLAGFLGPVDYPVGANPTSLAVGDLDGDGQEDLAVANHDDSDVSILEVDYRSSTTFEQKVDYPVGPGPEAIVIADLSGDGRSDMAVANEGDGSISILEADYSGGAFESKVDLPAGGRPSAMVAAKFGRTQADVRPTSLAVTDLSSGNVSVTLFSQKAIPAAPVDYKVGDSPSALVTHDFNRDGYQDIATANSGDGTISVLPGRADSTFGDRLDTTLSANPLSLAGVDLNNDARQDLVVAKADGTVSILRGKGDGGFKTQGLAYPVGANPVSIALGKFNNDLWPDLATANYDDGDVSVLEGNADGSFSPNRVRDYQVGGHPSSIVAIERRAQTEALAVANAGDGDVSVLINDN